MFLKVLISYKISYITIPVASTAESFDHTFETILYLTFIQVNYDNHVHREQWSIVCSAHSTRKWMNRFQGIRELPVKIDVD